MKRGSHPFYRYGLVYFFNQELELEVPLMRNFRLIAWYRLGIESVNIQRVISVKESLVPSITFSPLLLPPPILSQKGSLLEF